MATASPKCPQCKRSSTSEVMRRFKVTHEGRGDARARVRIWWICDYCGHEWVTVSHRRWDDVHGAANRNPTEYRQRVERYAKRLYNRVFDYPPGSFKDDPEGFAALAVEYGGRLCTRFGGRVGREVAETYILRAADKLLARWDHPTNLKYLVKKALDSQRNGGGPGD
jgi:hypothetical protein